MQRAASLPPLRRLLPAVLVSAATPCAKQGTKFAIVSVATRLFPLLVMFTLCTMVWSTAILTAHGRTLWTLTALPREPLAGLVLQFYQPFDCDLCTRSRRECKRVCNKVSTGK